MLCLQASSLSLRDWWQTDEQSSFRSDRHYVYALHNRKLTDV